MSYNTFHCMGVLMKFQGFIENFTPFSWAKWPVAIVFIFPGMYGN